VTIVPFGRWLAAQTKQELEESEQREEYLAIKHLPNKDRVTQLVLIGVEMSQEQITALLDTALVV
jgi:hypothetical protein